MLNHPLELGTLRIKEPAANFPLGKLSCSLKQRGQIGVETLCCSHTQQQNIRLDGTFSALEYQKLRWRSQVTPHTTRQFRDNQLASDWSDVWFSRTPPPPRCAYICTHPGCWFAGFSQLRLTGLHWCCRRKRQRAPEWTIKTNPNWLPSRFPCRASTSPWPRSGTSPLVWQGPGYIHQTHTWSFTKAA